MPTPIYVVDAFASKPFRGNPAGVCILQSPAEEEWMQSVAAEMKHAETAFLWPEEDRYRLRWFTPTVEVDLCGHATLASAHVLYETGLATSEQDIQFTTRSGILTASKSDKGILLDFPSEEPSEGPIPGSHAIAPGVTWTGRNRMDWFVVVDKPGTVRNYEPDYRIIQNIGMRGLILTAQLENDAYDFVSRFFAPQSGVDEDPVTGSAHCALAPFWAKRTGKQTMNAYQASPRGGEVGVTVKGDRVQLEGSAVTVLSGELRV